MHRELLNYIPSWMFITLIMFFLTILATLSFIIVRRFYPKLLTKTMSPAFGVMGTSYGFLLGFAIAILWQNYTSTNNIVDAEAANFNLIINDLQLLPPNDQKILIQSLKKYVDIMKDTEWEAMRWGSTASGSWSAIGDMYSTMQKIHPNTKVEHTAYDDIYRQIAGIVQNRAVRIHAVQTILPVGARILLIFGAFFIIFSVAVNDNKNTLNHFIAMLMVCFLLSFNLGIVFILAFPFSGDFGIQGGGLNKVVAYRINQLEKRVNTATNVPQVD